jgi:hypothetical protein
MPPVSATRTAVGAMTLLIDRLRKELQLWWDRRGYRPEKNYMRGRRQA